MDDSSSTPTPRVLWLLPASLIVAAAIVLVVMFIYLRDIGPAGPNGPGNKPAVKKRSPEENQELLSMRDRVIGHLENNEFATAEQLLLKIGEQLPNDAFVARNLVICRELALDAMDRVKDADQRPAALKQARAAVDALKVIEPASHVTHILSARVAVIEEKLEEAAADLRRATEIAPDSAPIWYEQYTLKPYAPGEAPPTEVVNALRKAYELAPDNLFVLKDWLPLQAILKEPGVVQTVTQARETLAPYAEVIKTHTRLEISTLLDKLQKAVEAEQWPIAASTANIVKNIILPESARDDRYVRLNSLEYLLFDFAPSFYKDASLAPEFADRTIPIKFDSSKEQLTLPAGARQLVISDFNLDSRIGAAALLQNQVTVCWPLVLTSANETATQVTVEIGEGFRGILAVDLDDDVDRDLKNRAKDQFVGPLADPDLIVFGPAGFKMYENRLATGGGTREFVVRPAGELLDALRDVRAVVPGDLDLDGDLDLVTITAAGLRCWSNRGNWSFAEITAQSKLPPASFGPTAAVFVDWDHDSDTDLLVAGTEGFGLLECLRHGRFRWRTLDGEFASLRGATSLLVEQLGNGGSWNVIGAGTEGIKHVLTQTTVAGLVSAKKLISISPQPVDRCDSFDFDNDGIRDLLTLIAQRASVWRGLPDGRFMEVEVAATADLREIAAVAACDVDRDGDEDLLHSTGDQTTWAINEGGNAHGWLDVILVGEQVKQNEQNYSKRVNHLGVGSTIELKTGAGYQAQVVRGLSTHFGLGSRKNADVMRIMWTNGIPQDLVAPPVNTMIFEPQKLTGSCPYLYVWDGEKFAFYTDLLWNAPLGLKFAENVIAPWREWEYLKIDGDKLRVKDGQYQLRVTAELWEIEYFDEIKLFAIDHPAGTDIFTNEKVGPASLAEHKIHTVAAPRLPIAARDTRGRDVLDQIRSRDGVYTKTFDHKVAQGLTEEHFLELDLGEWKRVADNGAPGVAAPQVTLYLTGWMYPGSTSLRVQHSQNPDLAQPRPPALHAVDAEGRWREVRPFMGFPGGKTKTIAVDISDVFAPESTDHRLRIVTNMEFYWEAAFYTVDDRPVEIRQAELPLVGAVLRDRGGVSLREWPATGNGPEFFDYQRLVPGEMWPPISGAFTRYGDVAPLLTARDDHLVVMHPGDEIQLTFSAPIAGLPEGWVRDFVIFNVGWDKDCDANTVYGETSEPLPFRDMTVYAHRDGQARERDAEYERFLGKYQTRTRARAPFWNRLNRN